MTSLITFLIFPGTGGVGGAHAIYAFYTAPRKNARVIILSYKGNQIAEIIF